jgi:hypothetical protein
MNSLTFFHSSNNFLPTSYINIEEKFLQESANANLLVSLIILHLIVNQIFSFLRIFGW